MFVLHDICTYESFAENAKGKTLKAKTLKLMLLPLEYKLILQITKVAFPFLFPI